MTPCSRTVGGGMPLALSALEDRHRHRHPGLRQVAMEQADGKERVQFGRATFLKNQAMQFHIANMSSAPDPSPVPCRMAQGPGPSCRQGGGHRQVVRYRRVHLGLQHGHEHSRGPGYTYTTTPWRDSSGMPGCLTAAALRKSCA